MNYFETGMELINKIEDLGYEAYLVGGCVRDLLLFYPINDVDITTNMPEEEIKKNFDTFDNGSKYLSLTINYNDFKFEITHFRLDSEYLDNRHPSVIYAKSLEEDSKRRDFTINALAYDKNKNVIDYHNGLNDLKNKVIKAIGNPDTRFKEDSLRILRALYFAGKLGFYIDSETEKAMVDNKDLLKNLSDERLFDYFKRILYANYDYGIQYINHFDLFSSIEEYKLMLNCVKREYREEDLVFYYYLKYNKYFSLTSAIDKKYAKEAKLVLDNNFDLLYLYKYKNSYLRCENVFKNLGYDTKSIDNDLDNLVLNYKNPLALEKEEFSKLFSGKEIGFMIDKVEREILYKRLNNTKEDIIKFLKG